MSLTVAAVHYPYCHSPYLKADVPSRSPGGEFNSSCSKDHFHLPLDIRSVTPGRNPRWSQCSTHGESTEEEKQMSSNGTAYGSQHIENPREQRSDITSQTSQNVLAQTRMPVTMEGHSGQAPDHLSIRRDTESTSSSSDRRLTRPLGVHSILNPPHVEEIERRSRRQSAIETEAESRAKFTPPSSIAPLSRPPSSNDDARSETSPPAHAGPRVVRRILTPMSPRSHRAATFGRIATGTIDAQETPFLSPSSKMHLPEPGATGHQPVPPQTSQVSQHSPFIIPAAPTPPLVAPQRTSVSMLSSARASPSPSYSSYSQSGVSGQTSPAMPPRLPGSGPTPPGSYRLTPSPVIGSLSNVPPASLENEQGFGIPVVSSGQNYQLLTIDTTKGHMQLPVEVQAASRVADEKRKRNAGASARFRARRKEKEREASSKISNLEHELAYAQEDSRYYRQERDYLAEVILKNVPQYEGYLRTRPPSPRHKRAQLLSRPNIPVPGTALSDSSLSLLEQYDDSDEEPPTIRRRTEPYPHSTASTAAPSPHPYPPPFATYPPGIVSFPPQHHPPGQFRPSTTNIGGPPSLNTRPPPALEPPERGWPPRTNPPR